MGSTVLGLDVGTKRIGVAVSDPTRLIARAVTTITVERYADAADAIAELARDLGAATIVIGLPLTMRGDEGEQVRITRLFGMELAKHMQLPIEYLDERLTTKLSNSTMRLLGVSARHKKSRRDGLAAVFILQTYLDIHSQ